VVVCGFEPHQQKPLDTDREISVLIEDIVINNPREGSTSDPSGKVGEMQSFLRWAGSKRQLVNRIAEYWSASRSRYVEPFCGSACVFFQLEPADAVLGDVNSSLVQTYRMLQLDVESVIDCLRRLPLGEDSYYQIRGQNPESLSEAELAARFIYLNQYCFNGLYRTDSNGRFNVPFGRPKRISEFNVSLLRDAASALRSTTLVAGDFEDTLIWARPGDFVYMDPPYVVEGRRVFSSYGPRSFKKEDLHRLSNCLGELDHKSIGFVVSYAASPEARELFQNWKTCRVRTRRNIAGFAGARKYAFEIIATNIEMKGS
jgi:DNA adenine methylase